MWESTVLVEREQLVDAPPEKVWELAGSPAALSVLPGWFAFSVPGAVEGTDRIHCLLVSGQSGFLRRAVVVDVREEVPGELISWQLRSTEPAGKQVFTLSVRPRAGRSAVRIAVSDVVHRGLASSYQPYWQRHVKTWLGGLRAAAEGRAPWPQAAMPAEMQRAMAAPGPLRKPVEASTAVVIRGEPDAVWEAAMDLAPDRQTDPEYVAWGNVPGTPLRGAGQMQYYVRRLPGGRLVVPVYMVTELAEGHRAVFRLIGHPREFVHVITPVPGGTRLELTARWSGRAARAARGKFDAESTRAELQRSAEDYQAIIEGTAPAAKPPAADTH